MSMADERHVEALTAPLGYQKYGREKLVREGYGLVQEKWVTHYSSNHQILLVGEGDFSFSLVLAQSFGSGSNIVASSLNSYGEVLKMYRNAKSNLMNLKLLGATLLHGVDATKMKYDCYLKMRRFDRVVFNFPHAGFHGKEDDALLIGMHRKLVLGFFMNARCLLRSGGEIHVNHKTTAPYSDWNIEDLACQSSLTLLARVDFKKEDYPGYNNKRGDSRRCDEDFPLGECSTFKLIDNADAWKIGEVRKQFVVLEERYPQLPVISHPRMQWPVSGQYVCHGQYHTRELNAGFSSEPGVTNNYMLQREYNRYEDLFPTRHSNASLSMSSYYTMRRNTMTTNNPRLLFEVAARNNCSSGQTYPQFQEIHQAPKQQWPVSTNPHYFQREMMYKGLPLATCARNDGVDTFLNHSNHIEDTFKCTIYDVEHASHRSKPEFDSNVCQLSGGMWNDDMYIQCEHRMKRLKSEMQRRNLWCP